MIYFISRTEASAVDRDFLEKYRAIISQIKSVVRDDGNYNRLFNYAMHHYVLSDRRVIAFSDQLVPLNAISSLAEDRICVRREDFFSISSEELLHVSVALYDLHDLAHQSCSTLCHKVYGSRYFDLLVRLPKRLRALVESKGLKTANAIQFSDGLVFSELLLGTYEQLDGESMNPDEIIDVLADLGTAYFLNKKGLLHFTTQGRR